MYKQQLTLYPVPTFLILLFLYWAAALFIQPQLGNILLLFDNGDLFLEGGYFSESNWLDTPLIAYQDYVVEYPPVGLYSYSLPRLFFNIYSEQDFLFAFTFIALFPMLAIFFLLLKRQQHWAIFLCTPTFFYFGLCRFDTFPTLASLLAILFILDRKPMLGAVMLGLAIGIKWYPMVLALPLLAMQTEKLKWSLVLGVSTLFFCFHHLWFVDWQQVLATYTFHTGRGTNGESFLYLIGKYIFDLGSFTGNLNDNNIPALTNRVFFLMQFIPSAILAVYLYQHRIKPSREILAISAIISIFAFIFFAKFHSPQWLIWVLPFFILLGDKLILWVYVALDILNYVTIAIVSNIVPKSSWIFDLYNLGRVVLSLWIMLLVIRKLVAIVRQQTQQQSSFVAVTPPKEME